MELEIIDSNGLPILVGADEFVIRTLHKETLRLKDIGSVETEIDVLLEAFSRLVHVLATKKILDKEDVEHIARG